MLKKIIFAAALGVTTVAVTAVDTNLAYGQSATHGAIRGVIKDKSTGEPLAGVTVIATSPALQGAQSGITDETGAFVLTTLPPGEYVVQLFYDEITVNITDVMVSANGTTNVSSAMNLAGQKGEVIEVKGARLIDTTTSVQGIKINKEVVKNLPVPGRSFESVANMAAGTRGDGLGVSVSGSSSLENNYMVDGINVGSMAVGTVGSPVINDFLEEIEVITGGYNAEYGRSTGGVISVVTKSGTNKFQGQVFGYLQPGQIVKSYDPIPSQVSPISVEGNVGYNYNVGFDLGGPIIKDKLWFYVGFAPIFVRTDYNRSVNRRTDCRVQLDDGSMSDCNPASISDPTPGFADGKADVDPETGLYITDRVESVTRSAAGTALSTIAKLNFAATANQQGQITLNMTPQSSKGPVLFGAESANSSFESLQTDVSAKWTSKFNNNKTEIEANVGWHRESNESTANDPSFQDEPLQVLRAGHLSRWADIGGESAAVREQCADNTAADPYKFINNCFIEEQGTYIMGGPGSYGKEVDERRTAKLSMIQRVKLLGQHEFKAGGDIEINRLTTSRLLSGGAFFVNVVGEGYVQSTRNVQFAPMGNTDPRYDQMCQLPNPEATGAPGEPTTISKACDFLAGTPGTPGTQISSETFNWSAYIRDSWQIRPNLTVNLGLRYEEQRLRWAEALQYTIDPVTGDQLGKNAMTLTGNWAPRVGAVYDWTKEGKSKIYGNWGRFYQSIPLQINKRSFGGEVTLQQYFDQGECKGPDGRVDEDPLIGAVNGKDCLLDPDTPTLQEQYLGASGTLISPTVNSQFLDEIVGGVEYEIMNNLKVGVAVSRRSYGRVLEDVSTDGANTYLIANPGEISDEALADLQARIDATSDDDEKKRLQKQYDLFEGIRLFDKPRRDYQSVVLTATRRFSKEVYGQASYTFSQNKGNYPGLFSPTNGQVDPNISSQYDLVELLANRNGFLDAQDVTHNLKFDGYYTFDLKKAGSITVGASWRMTSGTPYGALAGHSFYGQNESFLLPRGSKGRTPIFHRADAQLSYSRKLGKRVGMELFAQFFNLYDNQAELAVDDTYAFNVDGTNASNPVVGGEYADLIWAKTVNRSGVETRKPLERNPNYGNAVGRQAPLSGRLGFRVTF